MLRANEPAAKGEQRFRTKGYGSGINCYVCASVWCGMRRKNNELITRALRDSGINVFLPQEVNPLYGHSSEHTKYSFEISDMDLTAIKEADFGMLIVPHGEDSAHEAGFFAGAQKPIIAVIPSYEQGWLEHWMVKTTVNAVFTMDSRMHREMMDDPILCRKRESLFHLRDMRKLPQMLHLPIQKVDTELGRRYSELMGKLPGGNPGIGGSIAKAGRAGGNPGIGAGVAKAGDYARLQNEG